MIKLLQYVLIILSVQPLLSQERFPSYYSQNDMELATPGTIIFGLGGYINPATLSFLSQPNLYFMERQKF